MNLLTDNLSMWANILMRAVIENEVGQISSSTITHYHCVTG